MRVRTRVLGIDPGSRITGYGIIDTDGFASEYIASGCIRTETSELAARLEVIFSGIQSLVAEYSPAQIAVEKVFVHRNADSALKLGQARAAAICATFGGEVTVAEYAARAVKQAVVGRGGADKRQVQHMVKVLLKLDWSPAPDEADALAVALCHAHTRSVSARMTGASPDRQESTG